MSAARGQSSDCQLLTSSRRLAVGDRLLAVASALVQIRLWSLCFSLTGPKPHCQGSCFNGPFSCCISASPCHCAGCN